MIEVQKNIFILQEFLTYIPLVAFFVVKFISTIAMSSDNSLIREITLLIYSIFDYLKKKGKAIPVPGHGGP
jgi:hypothetical protein